MCCVLQALHPLTQHIIFCETENKAQFSVSTVSGSEVQFRFNGKIVVRLTAIVVVGFFFIAFRFMHHTFISASNYEPNYESPSQEPDPDTT